MQPNPKNVLLRRITAALLSSSLSENLFWFLDGDEEHMVRERRTDAVRRASGFCFLGCGFVYLDV